MGYPHVREIIHLLKLMDYLHVHADNQWYNYYLLIRKHETGILEKTRNDMLNFHDVLCCLLLNDNTCTIFRDRTATQF